MSEFRRCPECLKDLPIADGVVFDEDENLKCNFCDAIVFPSTSKAERNVESKIEHSFVPRHNPITRHHNTWAHDVDTNMM